MAYVGIGIWFIIIGVIMVVFFPHDGETGAFFVLMSIVTIGVGVFAVVFGRDWQQRDKDNHPDYRI